jgi:hypothetical protein
LKKERERLPQFRYQQLFSNIVVILNATFNFKKRSEQHPLFQEGARGSSDINLNINGL